MNSLDFLHFIGSKLGSFRILPSTLEDGLVKELEHLAEAGCGMTRQEIMRQAAAIAIDNDVPGIPQSWRDSGT